MDFRTPHTVGSRINEPFQQLINGTGYDHNYVLNKEEAGTLTFAAKCVEPESGRSLEVYTTEPGVQVYTANWQSGFSGWHGATFPARSEQRTFPVCCSESGRNLPSSNRIQIWRRKIT